MAFSKPTSTVPEIQRRIDRAVELMQSHTEEEIFWMRFQAACTAEAKERRGENTSFKASSAPMEDISKKD